MIISSGYKIAGPEVEAALLQHPYVAECAVIGVPDKVPGALVEAHVVLNEGVLESLDTVAALQDQVKAIIAPFKYPRSVKFCAALPKAQTGRIQRYLLKQETNSLNKPHASSGSSNSSSKNTLSGGVGDNA